jgi:signal transduction histidine kinase
MNPKKDLYRVIYQMIALSFLVFILFGGVLFFYLLPKIETVLLSQKKIMLKSMVQVAVGFIENQYQAASKGNISTEAAKQNSIDVLRSYRYGEENKYYFWINDLQPKMVMHPYRNDLEGSDLSKYSDPEGKFLFQESVKLSKESGEGYISYRWQAKDDIDRVIPKLSYVKEFKQ